MPTKNEIELVDRLINESATRQGKRRMRTKYYRGEQRLSMMGLSTPPEMRHLQTVINWSRTCVDALAERLDIEGFRTGSAELDAELWRWWKLNHMPVQSDSGHVEALAQGAAFIVVGLSPDPTVPLFTVESSACISVQLDPAGRSIRAAVRRYEDESRQEAATLYLSNENVYLQKRGGRWVEFAPRWIHNTGVPLVVPILNRVQVEDPFGETEMKDVMTIVDAVCRTATNLSTASETLAVPSRYISGASPEDFIDSETGEQVPAWEAYLGRLNALSNAEAKVQQLPGADLKNFTETITMYGKLVSSVTGLPLHYLGVSSDGNPTAADAITAAEARHVKRAERKQQSFGVAWSQAMLLAIRLIYGELAADPRFMVDTVWRNASTPTEAAKTDAVVKLVQSHVIPIEGAWIELGYDQDKRDLYRQLMSSDPLEKMVAALANPVAEPAEADTVDDSDGA